MTLETNLESRCCELAKRRGGDPIKMDCAPGVPDRLILWGHGFHFWIEFKKEKTGRVEPAQIVWKKYLERIGDKVFVVDTYDEFVVIIAAIEREHGLGAAYR